MTSPTPTGRPAFRSPGCVQPVFAEGAQAIHGNEGGQTDMLSPRLTFLGRWGDGEAPLLGREDRRGLPEERAFRPRPESEKSQHFTSERGQRAEGSTSVKPAMDRSLRI